MNGNNRTDITIGKQVNIVQKHNQRTGQLSSGVVERILTKSDFHPHGIKVKLTNGLVGRVKDI